MKREPTLIDALRASVKKDARTKARAGVPDRTDAFMADLTKVTSERTALGIVLKETLRRLEAASPRQRRSSEESMFILKAKQIVRKLGI